MKRTKCELRVEIAGAACSSYQNNITLENMKVCLNGKTPAEVAGIKVEGQNRWITVIQNAKLSSMKN